MSSRPVPLLGLSPAQRQVLVALKRRGEATAESLAEDLGITPSGVRQHLVSLSSAGLVSSRHERGRVGRPADLYHGTDLAEAHVSGASPDFTLELLALIDEEDPNLVPRLLDRRRNRRVSELHDRLDGEGFSEQVQAIVKLLDDEGYLTAFEELAEGTYRLTLHNCAIWAVASQYGHACTSELDFLREALPTAVIERVSHKVAGAYVCGYEIRSPAVATRRSAVARIPVVEAAARDKAQSTRARAETPESSTRSSQ
jgi:predicted ArsR family transcriptional regulator